MAVDAGITVLDPRTLFRCGNFRGSHYDGSQESKTCVVSVVCRTLNIMRYLGLLRLGQLAFEDAANSGLLRPSWHLRMERRLWARGSTLSPRLK